MMMMMMMMMMMILVVVVMLVFGWRPWMKNPKKNKKTTMYHTRCKGG